MNCCNSKLKVVFIVSAGGAVLNRLLSHEFLKNTIHEVVSDRDCEALKVAKNYNVKSTLMLPEKGSDFSLKLSQRYADRSDIIFISFYTRLLSDVFISEHKGRVFNCHPSLLPSFKGLHGFEETYKSNSLFMGCTLHEVDSGMDSGLSVIQAAIPLDRNTTYEINRHKVFLAQYYSTLQFLIWIQKGIFNVGLNGAWRIDNVKYEISIFSPNLDLDFFDEISEACEL